MMTDIHEQLSNVEIKLAFQDDLVETLNQIVIGQQQQLDLLQQQVQLLYQQFKSLQPSDIADLAQEVPPPHY
ncbi:MAG: SlyX family protein [Agitococcus sp.]|jgi:SlyX protein|nr:SlyX family protein [Agitococcus sp.]HQV80384.1 SlyX family protein [Agitococcus sp.]